MACSSYGCNTIRQIVKATNLQTSDPMLHPLLYIIQGVRYRKLEVILTTGIDKLGKAGETVKVAPGYFRNHLMPKLLAVPNIEKYANLIKEQRKIYQPVEEVVVKVVTMTKEDKMKEYERAAKRLDKTQLVLRRLISKEKFRSRSTKDEPIELQLAVTKDDLVAEVARQLGIQLAPENLHLVAPLSTCGEHEVQVSREDEERETHMAYIVNSFSSSPLDT